MNGGLTEAAGCLPHLLGETAARQAGGGEGEATDENHPL